MPTSRSYDNKCSLLDLVVEAVDGANPMTMLAIAELKPKVEAACKVQLSSLGEKYRELVGGLC